METPNNCVWKPRNSCRELKMDIFGNWNIIDDFQSGVPYPHVIIHNFFKDDIFQSIISQFGHPEIDSGWVKYWNPLEKKYALNLFSDKPIVQKVFNELQSEEFIDRLKQITRIPDLQTDPHMHGAGLHYHPTNGKLDMHLDYSIHPISKLERRVNLIIYINNVWQEEWGGALELWDNDFTKCVKKVFPMPNTAVLFQTSDISYHGIPRPIECPENIGRQSLAIYYMSQPRENITHRYKAEFRPLPNQIITENMQRLYDIRKVRNITKKDLEELNIE